MPIGLYAQETRDWLESVEVKVMYREYASGHEFGMDEHRGVVRWLLERGAQS
jgi:hypothetical protein